MTIRIPSPGNLTPDQLHGHACVKCGHQFGDDSPSQLPVDVFDGHELFACEPCVLEAERPSSLPTAAELDEIERIGAPDTSSTDSKPLPGVAARSGQVLLYAPCCCGLTHEQPLTPDQARALSSTLTNHADHIAPA